jgi:dUTP pyrophosphatase
MEIIKLNPALSDLSTRPEDAGYDLQANIETPIVLHSGESQLVSTGIRLHIRNPGLVGFVLPRSGKGTSGLVLKNLTGVIDSGYQGEIKVCLWNSNDEGRIVVQPLEKIAQLVFLPCIHPRFLDRSQDGVFTGVSARGSLGFGSTDREESKQPDEVRL